MKVRNPQSGVRSPTFLRLAIWLFLGSACLAAFLIAMYFDLFDPACDDLIMKSVHNDPIPLSAECRLTAATPADEMVQYLERERKRRGLIFKEWIVCEKPSAAPVQEFPFERDQNWLPSYVPLTYEFRRTVIILPYSRPIPKGSPVAGEVCLMPWRKYISRLSGQCSEKFSVWK
ncbi:MAG: hypothetical protein WAO35_15100 [Terriglobia bacterium]